MFRVFKIILFLILFCLSLFTTAGNLEIKFPNISKKDLDPGSTINIMVKITNNGDSNKNIKIQINNNNGNFKLISDYSSMPIEKNSSINKILGIQISNTTNAGDFSIELEALENPDSLSFGKVVIPINVKPKYELSINKLKAPISLFSGDTTSIYYLIQNLSNIDITVKNTVIYGLQNKINTYKIPKDSSIISRYLISVSKDLAEFSQQTAIVIATIADKPETEKNETFIFDVFPIKNVKFDKFNRIPVKVGVLAISSNKMGKMMYSSMFDIQGTGTIGRKNESTLNFHLRGPNRSGNPLFGLNDEYSLKYVSPRFEVALGDHSFGLSTLTESSRSGRGVLLKYNLKKLTFNSFYHKPRYYPLINQVYAAFANYTFNPGNELTAGFLSKRDSFGIGTKLFTISSKNTFFSALKTDVEIAAGKNRDKLKKAYRAALFYNRSILSSSLNYLFAEPDFPGYMTNSFRLNSGVSLKLKKFTIALNYDLNSTNMALDTLYSNMPHGKNFNVSTSYRITQKSTFSLAGYISSMKDQSPKSLFDYERTSGRLTFNNRMGNVSLTLQGDIGKMTNFLLIKSGEESLMYNGSIFANYATKKNLSASAFVTYQGGQQKISGSELFYYGCSFSTNIFKTVSVSLQYNSNFEWIYYTCDRSLLSLDIHGQINNKNEIRLGASYNLIKNTLNNKEYNIQLGYVHTLNIPVSKKKNIGSVTGKLINQGIEKVSGVRINLNGIIAVSDKEGNFRFPSIPVGTYVLGIDASSLGINIVTELPGPFIVNVEPAKVTNYNFAMTNSASIVGRLVVKEDERVSEKGFIPVKDQLEKLIIEVSNEKELFRIFTDADGSFRFEDMRPGNWKVIVYPNGLPTGYQLETSQFNVNLSSGKSEKVEVIIKKKARQIQFQKSVKNKQT